MEGVELCERESVINVLTQGKELANELKRKLHPSTEACDVLLDNILSSYENAITLLVLIGNTNSSQFSINNLFESPNSIEGSARSASEQSSKDKVHNFKKRKTLGRWSEQVRVCSGKGSEGQVDDGYSWRKYGQKDILGANHPRAYYRCTHRNTQGCLATKHVQQADDEATSLEIVYKGKHSCRQDSMRVKKEKERLITQPQQIMIIDNEPSSLSSCLETENQELDSFPSFSFPSTSIEPSNFNGTSYSPPFVSPAISESFFSLNDFGIGIGIGFQSSDLDFGEIISNPTPIVTSFTFGDLDFLENLNEFE